MKPQVEQSIVIPVFRNESNISELLSRLTELVNNLAGKTELILVVDGSPDNSEKILIKELSRSNLYFKILVHSRNFGAFAAIRTGLKYSTGKIIGVMAADLQEPPELLIEMFKELQTDQFDVAVGVRKQRNDNWFFDAISNFSWSTLKQLVFPEMPRGGVDIFACTRNVSNELSLLSESHSSLIGQLFWLGYRRVEVPYIRLSRENGKSSWTISKKINYFLDSIFSFTNIPIRVLTNIGIIGITATLIAATAVMIGYANGGIKEPGYTPLMLVLLFSTFAILGGMGILGSYIWRAFENTKQRPLSIVQNVITSDDF